MHASTRRDFLRHVSFAGLACCAGRCAGAETAADASAAGASSAAWTAAERAALERAAVSADIAGYSLSKVHRWLHEKALPAIDEETGLYRADGQWNYRDTAADCYPFLAWAAHVVDRDVLYGPVLKVLEAEQRLCNHIDRIPVRFDWTRKAKDTSVGYDAYIFEASEYVKDGLVAIVEATGKSPWYERMKGIQEDIWKHARVDTPQGKIPSTNVEVNGDQLQALPRLFTMSGDQRFLDWAQRLGDHYLLDEAFVPTRLRDHGCEIIGGLGLLLGVLSEVDPPKAQRYLPRLARMLDEILARGTNPHGLMYNTLGQPGSGLSDGWGYNYVGYLCWDAAAGEDRYRPQIVKTLKNLMQPAYRDYLWEGKSIDGYADSIEGAIYVLNRVPVAEGFQWVDRETARNVARSHEPLDEAKLWGTMKLEANGVRTVLLHALMHTQGVIARPWRRDLRLGAAPAGDGGLAVQLEADQPWQGRLEFDIPRHRLWLGCRHDWPRMNTLPEWFVVDPQLSYQVECGQGEAVSCGGKQLSEGLPVEITADQPWKALVRRLG